jgi:hypothetical protein
MLEKNIKVPVTDIQVVFIGGFLDSQNKITDCCFKVGFIKLEVIAARSN